MSQSDFGFLPDNNLPSHEDIVDECEKAGCNLTGIPFPNQPIVAWIEYGPYVALAEALTQDWVAKELNAKPEAGVRVPRVYDFFSRVIPEYTMGYIVMEYIDAPDCTETDLCARPVGGGPVVYSFFVDDRTSPFTYDTVDELEQHVNGILKYKEDTRQVRLVSDAHDGLYLCPCDIHPGNFKKCQDGQVVPLDVRATCFLPPSFFAVAIIKADNIFAVQVADRVNYPKSDDVEALAAASFYMVPFGKNTIGIPRNLRKIKRIAVYSRHASSTIT